MTHFKEFTKLYLAINIVCGICIYLLGAFFNLSWLWFLESDFTNWQNGLLLSLLFFAQAWLVYTTNEFVKKQAK